MSYIEASKALYDSRLRQHYGRPRGCWPWTISRLERQFGHPFPAAYREFLRWMGEHQHGPFRGSACFPACLGSNNECLPELLAENQIQFPLPTQFLAFFVHQGYIAVWFALPAVSDDPPVWTFHEVSMSQPEQRFTFSEWLLDYMHHSVRIAERLYEQTESDGATD